MECCRAGRAECAIRLPLWLNETEPTEKPTDTSQSSMNPGRKPCRDLQDRAACHWHIIFAQGRSGAGRNPHKSASHGRRSHSPLCCAQFGDSEIQGDTASMIGC